jgi:hypothetical protein
LEGDQKERSSMKERELERNVWILKRKSIALHNKRDLLLAHKQLKNEGIDVEKITREEVNQRKLICTESNFEDLLYLTVGPSFTVMYAARPTPCA